MARSREKRSSERGTGHVLELAAAQGSRVGGRQAESDPSPGGGGYLGSRTSPKLAKIDRDQRLDELRTMGMQGHWLLVADAIGADAFLTMWRILDAERHLHSERGDLELRLRPYRSYLRFQRNRYIEALVGLGMNVHDVQAVIQRELCERISIRHIYRIATGP